MDSSTTPPAGTGPSHRALLLFVPEYTSTAWQPLDYLDDEYRDLRTALTDQGYAIDPASGCRKFESKALVQAIARFIADGRDGEHLMVFLSGHGFHHDSKHWFAGTDSSVETWSAQSLSTTNVDLENDWADQAERSAAGQILFVVDACRDRLEDDRSAFKVPAGTDKLGYLMACEPERSAAVAGPDGARFSLFTQAMREVLADAQGELLADRFCTLLETAMADLRTRQSNPPPPQVPRLGGDTGPRFVVLPERSTEGRRVRLVREHPVWAKVTDSLEAKEWRAQAETVVRTLDRELASEREGLRDDPWLDWESDLRTSERLAELVDRAEVAAFTPAEAALLAVAPALYFGFRVRLAARADHRDLRTEWDQYPRLQRQTDPGAGPGSPPRDRRVAGSWVLHQTRCDPGNAHDHLSELVNFLRTVLDGTDELDDECSPPVVSWLFRAMRHGGGVLAEPPVLAAQARKGEPNYQRVGLMLCVARLMALDRSELPSVLVEHMGGREPIGLVRVRLSVDGARWSLPDESRGTLTLAAECGHQALMVALQEQVQALDGLLCSNLRIPGLADLPSRASDVQVKPETDPETGEPRFYPVATRFGLDATRVRDLLTGEALYGDRHLAIRELYQNAMDACQVRQAREMALLKHGNTPEWRGAIEFTQQLDRTRGRWYVDCVDNGSGMGRGELLHSFAQGGVRLSHLTSFQEEMLEWQKRAIPFQQISRFGIGVLSYFMIADEIEVVTRKFQRDGTPESTALRVTIDGPEHLFQVAQHQEDMTFIGDDCGTRIRLYLREDLKNFSCVKVLRSVLGVARFHTVADHVGTDAETWVPEEYGSKPDTGADPVIGAEGTVVPVDGGMVFWCERGGALLVDGISVKGQWFRGEGTEGRSRAGAMVVRGAVVNLRGPVIRSAGKKALPRLSVNRSEILDEVAPTVFALLAKRDAAEVLSASELLTEAWLEDIATAEPRIADAIVAGLVRVGAKLTYRDGVADLSRTGYLVGDREVRALWVADWPRARPRSEYRSRDLASHLPGHLALWRYAAHFPDGVAAVLGDVCPEDLATVCLRPAAPSDSVLLGHSWKGTHGTFATWDGWVAPGLLYRRAEEQHESPAWAAARLAELGLRLPLTDRATALSPTDLTRLTSADADGLRPSIRPGDPVGPRQLLSACGDFDVQALGEVMEILQDLGYDTSRCSSLLRPDSVEGGLIRAFEERNPRRAPWLLVQSTDHEHVADLAEARGLSVPEVLRILSEHGYSLPGQGELSGLSDGWRLTRPVPEERRTVASLADVHRMVQVKGCTMDRAVRLLEAFGSTVDAEIPEIPEGAGPSEADLELLVLPAAGGQRLDLRKPATLLDLHALGREAHMPLPEVARRLRSVGVEVPSGELPDALDGDDLVLLADAHSSHSSHRHGLDPRAPVPVAHLTIMAGRLGWTVTEVRDRLLARGMTLAELPELPLDLFDERTERILAGQWIQYSQEDEDDEVPFGHVLQVSAELGWELDATVEAMRARRLRMPEAWAEALPQVQDTDQILLKQDGDRHSTWLGPLDSASFLHVVPAADAAGMTVDEARSRLEALGVTVETLRFADDGFREEAWLGDILDGGYLAASSGPKGGIRDDLSVRPAYVRIVSRLTRRSPYDVARHLRAAGADIVPDDHPHEQPTPGELLLLREDAAPNGEWLPLDEPVSLEHLLLCAHRLSTTVTVVADRLRALGLEVSDVATTVAETWARVPRATAGC
ncbi:caspase family protein [Streptomyces sp. NBC_00234]|uniref:wHTH domain-containing protein n=1 Tax=Streptomyces sp. NBC_00234 TaxID=2903638 RepID=UPI002E287918|nr:caspase family protein [Streptomyces sp. NBC_00234]